MKLSVVIVSYNVRDFLVQCLDSVRRASAGLDVETWVVDNASADGSVDYAQRFFPEVHYIRNAGNVGFARANNEAIRQSSGEYVLLLNPDTIVGEGTLRGCLSFLDSHPGAGATGVRMLNRDGSFALESRRGLPTPATAFYKVCGLCALLPRHPRFGKYYMRYLDASEANPIEVISGAFMMLRRTALEQAGLLDEDYFMYGEDIDLSYCLLRDGWENWYQPLPMLHYKGESTQKTSFRYVHNFYNAMLIFFNKHLARRYRLAALAIKGAVVARASVEMTWQTLRRLRHALAGHTPPLHHTERMLFVGTDEGWEAVSALAGQRKDMEVVRSTRTLAQGGHAADGAEAAGCLYVLYQTDAPGATYDGILHAMSLGSQGRQRPLLGTFSMRTRTIILPNDILQ